MIDLELMKEVVIYQSVSILANTLSLHKSDQSPASVVIVKHEKEYGRF